MIRPDSDPRDERLRALFFQLRREEEQDAPPFAVAQPVRREDLRWRLIRAGSVIGAGVCAVAIVAALSWPRPRPAPERIPGVPVASITQWRPATDFLLDTPGRELLESTPALGLKPYLAPVVGPVVQPAMPRGPRRAGVHAGSRTSALP
jgi:hypothetical protein